VLKYHIEVVLLAMTCQQITSSAMLYLRMAEKITKSHLISSEGFRSDPREFSKICNLYVKNIMFVCSLPTSTSTWQSDYCNRPGGYISVELKSENINRKKAPTRQSHHPEKITQLFHRIQLHPRKILFKETVRHYNTIPL
jgi:hypothetical protein